MTQMPSPETPEVTVPVALKVLVFTLFGLIVIAVVAVVMRYSANQREKAVETLAQGPWEVPVVAKEGESIGAVSFDGRHMTVVIEHNGGGARVVLVDTRKGAVVGTVQLERAGD